MTYGTFLAIFAGVVTVIVNIAHALAAHAFTISTAYFIIFCKHK